MILLYNYNSLKIRTDKEFKNETRRNSLSIGSVGQNNNNNNNIKFLEMICIDSIGITAFTIITLIAGRTARCNFSFFEREHAVMPFPMKRN